MEITRELDRIYAPIKEDLQMVEKKLYDLVPTDMDPISTVERYILDNGGKRLRPALVLLSVRAVHSSNASDESASSNLSSSGTPLLSRAIAFAAAAELIHCNFGS